jgi:hypothetical protein
MYLYAFHFPLPKPADFYEVRKAIYDLVHAFPTRPPSSKETNYSLPERVWLEQERGLRSAEIARKLDISRAAVSRASKHLREIVATQQHEARINPKTIEPDCLNPITLEMIALFRNDGWTTAQIAKVTPLFKHTVRTAYHLIDARESKEPSLHLGG